MTAKQLQPIGYERNSTRQRHAQSRPLKDLRCQDCRIRSTPNSFPRREACPHKYSFAPSKNRFSILAELDQHPNQNACALDFLHGSSSGVHRRGKRGGKNNKPRFARSTQRPSKPRKSEPQDIEDLCSKFAALCLNDKDFKSGKEGEEPPRTGDGLPPKLEQSAVTRPPPAQRGESRHVAEESPHRWMPQFRPQTLPTQQAVSTTRTPAVPVMTSLVTLPRPLSTCLASSPLKHPSPTEPVGYRRKKSRFFPLSAFLSSSESAGRPLATSGCSPQKPLQGRTGDKNDKLTLISPTMANEVAVNAACNALDMSKTTHAPLSVWCTLQTTNNLSICSPPAQLSPTTSLTDDDSSDQMTIAIDSNTPLASIAPSAAVPALKCSLAIASLPSQGPTPSIRVLSSKPVVAAPTLPLRTPTIPGTDPSSWRNRATVPWLTPSESSSTTVAANSVPPSTELISVRKVPVTVDTPSPVRHILPLPKRAQRVVPAVPAIQGPAPVLNLRSDSSNGREKASIDTGVESASKFGWSSDEKTKKDIESFLGMGHAKDCWCSQHRALKHFPPKLSSAERLDTTAADAELGVQHDADTVAVAGSEEADPEAQLHQPEGSPFELPTQQTPPSSPELRATVASLLDEDLESVSLTHSHPSSPSTYSSDFEDIDNAVLCWSSGYVTPLFTDAPLTPPCHTHGQEQEWYEDLEGDPDWELVIPPPGYGKPWADNQAIRFDHINDTSTDPQSSLADPDFNNTSCTNPWASSSAPSPEPYIAPLASELDLELARTRTLEVCRQVGSECTIPAGDDPEQVAGGVKTQSGALTVVESAMKILPERECEKEARLGAAEGDQQMEGKKCNKSWPTIQEAMQVNKKGVKRKIA